MQKIDKRTRSNTIMVPPQASDAQMIVSADAFRRAVEEVPNRNVEGRHTAV